MVHCKLKFCYHLFIVTDNVSDIVSKTETCDFIRKGEYPMTEVDQLQLSPLVDWFSFFLPSITEQVIEVILVCW